MLGRTRHVLRVRPPPPTLPLRHGLEDDQHLLTILERLIEDARGVRRIHSGQRRAPGLPVALNPRHRPNTGQRLRLPARSRSSAQGLRQRLRRVRRRRGAQHVVDELSPRPPDQQSNGSARRRSGERLGTRRIVRQILSHRTRAAQAPHTGGFEDSHAHVHADQTGHETRTGSETPADLRLCGGRMRSSDYWGCRGGSRRGRNDGHGEGAERILRMPGWEWIAGSGCSAWDGMLLSDVVVEWRRSGHRRRARPGMRTAGRFRGVLVLGVLRCR